MTLTEDQLQELLHEAAPKSTGVDFTEVSRLGRRRYRRRGLVTALGVAVASVAVASLAALIAISGHSENATVSPRPVTDSRVTLTPVSASATAADLHADVAILTRRLAAAGIDGRAQVGTAGITLQLPASAAGSVAYLTTAGQVSFRIPGAVEPPPTTPTSAAAGSCLTAAGIASGNPPPCITTRLSASCPKPGTAEGRQVTGAPAKDWIVACNATGTMEYALAPQQLGGDAVAGATAESHPGPDGTNTGEWLVKVNFTRSGQSEWADLTESISTAAGCPASGSATCSIAIVVDGVVQSAPVIQGRIPGSAEISGSFTEQSAKALAAALHSGTLPMPLTVGRS